MAEAASVADAPDAKAPERSVRTDVSSPAVRRYAMSVCGFGLMVSAVAVVVLDRSITAFDWWAWAPLLALGFVAAEVASLEIEFRKGTITVLLSEIPIVVAVLFVPFPVAFAASLLATGGRGLWRRQHWVVASYNVGIAGLEISTVYLVAAAIHGLGAHGLVVPGAVGLLLGMVTANVLSVAAAGYLSRLISAAGAEGPSAGLVRALATTALVTPVLAVSGLELLRVGVEGWVLLAAVGTAFAALYRAYAVLLRERKDLDLVQRISSSESDSADMWPRVAELVRQQFNARRAVVRPPGGETLAVSGEPLAESALRMLAGPDPVSRAAQISTVRLHVSGDSGAQDLRLRGAAEVIAAPLGSGDAAGAIELHDRQNQQRGFGQADTRLLETLARHLSTAADNRRLLAQLRDDAYLDRLSGLGNRLGFTERAEAMIADTTTRSALSGRPRCAVLLADLDVLGQVNDALGHDWGDRLVVLVAERVRSAVTETAGENVTLGRVDGDTFAVFLLGAGQQHAERIAHQLAEVLGEPYPMDDLSVEASPAIGVASTSMQQPDAHPSVEQLVQQADVAMHAARSQGQPVRGYHNSMGQTFLRRFQLVTQFRAALDSEQVEVHYQPKLSLPGRSVVGAEALMRWTHPEFGPVDPEELVRILEATGLMDELTGYVMDRALQRCRAALDRGVVVPPAVNVSVRNLLSPAFPSVVADALARHDVPADMLTLEITETSVMGDAERTLPALRALHEMGVTLSVDDFGTGYSSLSYLRRLPVDEVKIDKSFVLGMGTDLGDLAVVRAIIDLGRSLGLRVVAEGVETDVVRDQLAAMGCDVIQGYLVARAMEPARFDTWLHTRTSGALEPGPIVAQRTQQ